MLEIVERDRIHMRHLRRALASAAAGAGAFPRIGAVASTWLPEQVLHVGLAGWGALVLALFIVLVEELFLIRDERRVRRSVRGKRA